MNTKIKLFASSVGVAGLALGTTLVPALAGNVTIGNDTTGANSVNTGRVSLQKSIIRLVSEFMIQHNVGTVHSETGNNDASMNTNDGTALSGSVNFSGGFSNTPASSVGPVINLGDLLSVRADNNTTGFSSLNDNSVSATAEAIINVVEEAVFDNSVNTDARTGNNAASMNTGSGFAGSGGVTGNLMVTNQAPSSGSGAIIVGGGSANVNVSNDTTGAQSVNTNTVDANKFVSVNVSENTRTNNTLTQHVDTGNNDASMNTGDGVVKSGNSNSSVSVTNATTSAAPVVVDAGSPVSVRADNRRTGFSSLNTNNTNLNETLIVDVNKTTTTNNSLHISSETGNNSASKNTGSGLVTTGSVNANFNVMNR